MEATEAFITLAISLGLGLLVGMQRERANSQVAGFRTFGLITVFGTLCGMLAQPLGGWIVAAGLLGVSMATAMANVLKLRSPQAGAGVTTEIAVLVMFVVGAFLVLGPREVAIVVAGAVAVLLYAKPIMHGFARRIGDQDMQAMMQFVLITLVILPLMPDRAYGPFEVLNPREIWWIVVLVVGISFGGYIALKLLGEKAGAIVGGLLGGVISSTATTVSYARRASTTAAHVNAAILVIMLASTVVYARVLFEVAAVARPILPLVAAPIGIMFGASALLSAFVWVRNRNVETKLPPQDNPTELKAAIVFGALYAVVSFAVTAGKHYFHDAGIYVVAAISGLTDMDAITLSTSRMVLNDGLTPATAWRAIVIASIANLFFKAGIVAVLGGMKLFWRIAALFAINIAVAAALLALWPQWSGQINEADAAAAHSQPSATINPQP